MINTQTLEELQNILWDYYKDVHGVRPRNWTGDQWDSILFLKDQCTTLDDIVSNMSEEQRKAEGWTKNDPFAQVGIPCEQQRAPMDAATLAIDTQMRKHYIESYGDI